MPSSDEPGAADPGEGDVQRTSPDGDTSPPRPHSRAGSVLAAAMFGLGEVLEPEKTKVVIEQESDDPFKDADLDLTFDGLPRLDDP
jgi:hypothetical protein